MSDEAAFLAALRATPADATARLVYADWLDERDRHVDAARQRVLADPARDELRLAFADACERAGDVARAEFVRVQVAKYALEAEQGSAWFWAALHVQHRNCGAGGKRGCSPWCRSFQREEELWGTVGDSFDTHGLKSRLPWENCENEPNTCLVRRGFVESVCLAAADWLAHGDAIREREPVGRVRLTTRPAWEMHPKYKDSGYARLVGREKIETVAPADELIRRLLRAEWPGVEFELPPVRITMTGEGPTGVGTVGNLSVE